MLQHVLGRARSDVYILNVVKCRPPNNRDPAPAEMAACRPFLEQQIDAIGPRAILALGSVAWKALSGQSIGIQRARGTWSDYQGIPLMPTFHPAYLLRAPDEKRLTFADLKAVRARLDAEASPG
jgi:DNA polymerase